MTPDEIKILKKYLLMAVSVGELSEATASTVLHQNANFSEPTPTLLSRSAVAKLFNSTTSYVDKLAKQKKIEKVTLSPGKSLITQTSVLQFINKRIQNG